MLIHRAKVLLNVFANFMEILTPIILNTLQLQVQACHYLIL